MLAMRRIILAGVFVVLGVFAVPVFAQDCAGWASKGRLYWQKITVEKVRACLDGGADATELGTFGGSALHWAAALNRDVAVTQALLDAGVSPDVWTEERDFTPIHGALLLNDNPQVALALLAAGADVNSPAKEDGHTPLHMALELNKSEALIVALLDAGADLNARDDSGRTPLHWAAQYAKSPELVRVLLARGADKTAKDAKGRTAFDILKYNRRLRGVTFND